MFIIYVHLPATKRCSMKFQKLDCILLYYFCVSVDQLPTSCGETDRESESSHTQDYT